MVLYLLYMIDDDKNYRCCVNIFILVMVKLNLVCLSTKLLKC